MKKEASEKKPNREKISFYCLIFVAAVVLLLLLWTIFGNNNTKMIKQQSYSNLIDTKEIAALSVSEFVYNGIAQSLKDNGEPDYNVLYKSTVKVSIDANNIEYTVNEEQKVITFSFPAFTIENPVINVGSISLIPNKQDLYMDDVIALCRNDALTEAKSSEKLLTSAQENIRSIIEAWYSPIIPDYSFEYIFDIAEGGELK